MELTTTTDPIATDWHATFYCCDPFARAVVIGNMEEHSCTTQHTLSCLLFCGYVVRVPKPGHYVITRT